MKEPSCANPRESSWMAALAVVLAVIGAVYTSAGLHRLVADVPGSFPVDLRLRWTESRLLVEGRNTQRVGHPDPLLPPTHEVMRHFGGGYPPWSYAFGLVVAPPIAWPLARWWFAALNLVAMAGIAAYAWRRARPLGRTQALVASLLVFASFPAAICLSYGQYGVLVSALVIGAVALLEQGGQWRAGLLLGLALVKPQLSATYCVAMAATRRWRTVLAIATVIGAGAAVMAWAVGETPGSVTSAAAFEMRYRRVGTNPVMNALSLLVNHRTAVLLLGLTGAALVAWIAVRRSVDVFRLACLAVVVAMFWTHRKHFDVAMMTLPLIWLWIEAARTRRALPLAVFFAVGVTLWAPVRDAQWDLWWVQAAQLIAWPAAAVVMLRSAEPVE